MQADSLNDLFRYETTTGIWTNLTGTNLTGQQDLLVRRRSILLGSEHARRSRPCNSKNRLLSLCSSTLLCITFVFGYWRALKACTVIGNFWQAF